MKTDLRPLTSEEVLAVRVPSDLAAQIRRAARQEDRTVSGYLRRHLATTLCSAHDDKQRSLSITLGPDGRTLLHCHAGCDTSAVIAKRDLTFKDLFERNDGALHINGHKRVVVDTYDYRDCDGCLQYQVVRY